MNSKILFYLREMRQIEARGWAIPVTCEIDPSNRCQNNCSFCISKNRTTHDDMDLNFALPVIMRLRDLGTKSITFTGGGEPTMNPRLAAMIEFVDSIGMRAGLITNGIDLNRIPFGSLDFVRISLDAGCAETYKAIKENDAFDRVIENIATARPRCHTLGLSYVICGQSAGDISKAEELALDLDVDYIQFKPDALQAGTKPCLRSAISFYTERYSDNRGVACNVAGLIGIITADGRYVYCCQHRYEAEYTVADLHEADLAKAIIGRGNMAVDNTGCRVCRYGNYAKEYSAYRDGGHAYMKHKEFL